MKVSSTITIFSSLALAAAQYQFNAKDNTFACTKSTGLAAYCAGGDIIIRCSNGVGHADNCNDNLAGEPPFGNNGLAGCYQTAPSSGDAACTKAGLVYPATGAGDSRLTAPYPIPNTGSKVVGTAVYKPSGASAIFPTGTGGVRPIDQNPTWSNITTVTVAAGPAYTAGATLTLTPSAATDSASSASSTARPQAYTGSAAASQTQTSSSPYWAFALFAVVALL
ncbi:hypothetical protein CAC42_5684 [Sphaceloma murrayae]|uniref:Uncharacterized protein n=1 Tax=Sphaceloma murrayae TaxID=2082308 RepID=A0A2K1QYV8_9PEZI|nr:hypothetical protein CAC42_5684 [Sphaceloma murrayae]